jgi:amiloride-sensitive sodium channel
MSDKVAMATKAKENMVFVVGTMNDTEKSAMSYTMKELIHECSFNGRECTMER